MTEVLFLGEQSHWIQDGVWQKSVANHLKAFTHLCCSGHWRLAHSDRYSHHKCAPFCSLFWQESLIQEKTLWPVGYVQRPTTICFVLRAVNLGSETETIITQISSISVFVVLQYGTFYCKKTHMGFPRIYDTEISKSTQCKSFNRPIRDCLRRPRLSAAQCVCISSSLKVWAELVSHTNDSLLTADIHNYRQSGD